MGKGDNSIIETTGNTPGLNGDSPDSKGTGSSGGTGGTGGIGGSGRDKTEAVVLELSPVEDEKQYPRKPGETDEQYAKRCKANKDRRERYERQKALEGKPVKVNRKKQTTQELSVIDSTQIFVILKTMSAVVASRPGMEMWALTDQEVKSIADPLNNIIAKADKSGMLTQHADAVALVVACGTILLPRIIMTITMQKAVKNNARTGNAVNTNIKPGNDKARKNVVPTESADKSTSGTSANDGNVLSLCGSATA